MSLDVLEQAINELSDHDSSWWPFLWIRPAKEARISTRRLACMALLFGVPAGALVSLLVAVLFPRTWTSVPLGIVGLPLALFVFGTLVFVPVWNRRAARLNRLRA